MVAAHVRGRPKPKRPLNAKPRIAARRSQGGKRRGPHPRRRTRRGNIAASGRAPGLPGVAVRRTQPGWAPGPLTMHRRAAGPEVGPSQRDPLTQSASQVAQCQRGPLTPKPSGQCRDPHPRRRTRHESIAASGRAPGLPALPSAGQPRNERHPCQRSAQAKETP